MHALLSGLGNQVNPRWSKQTLQMMNRSWRDDVSLSPVRYVKTPSMLARCSNPSSKQGGSGPLLLQDSSNPARTISCIRIRWNIIDASVSYERCRRSSCDRFATQNAIHNTTWSCLAATASKWVLCLEYRCLFVRKCSHTIQTTTH